MARTQLTIHTSSLFDSKNKRFISNISIDVDTSTGLITRTYERSQALPHHNVSDSKTIDLRGLTVLPGLVDAHTHIFLHGYSETPSMNQMRDESLVERVVRATNHARDALMAGFTTYRDLGTEGLRDADVHFRDTINRGIIPGPRLFVATECIASSSGYELRHENNIPGIGNDLLRISDAADGVYGVRAAVRRRIGAGADIVKFYADYERRRLRFPTPAWPGARRIRFPPDEEVFLGGQNPVSLLFTQEEMDAMVAEARASRAPIAAHAESPEAVVMAARAGVTTIEHGGIPSAEALRAMKDNNTIFVPTLAVYDEELRRATGYSEGSEREFREILAHTKAAYDLGVKLACGGDTGAFPHGENMRELDFMLEAGIPLLDVLQAATLHGWEACGADLCGRRFGSLEEGYAADIIALRGDVFQGSATLRRVDFVMKDGQVYKEFSQERDVV
ncbi:putative amidohydrolase domain-containing protein [Rosellinia necatrix]|uniref:Putative amidohydrolase domain-containing protein n=1 Tax=Rosellinia necatrix TaxID=77044 RepID=A0A1W2TIE8_ROSNE|nr:putative amidohydrolase domain-containing protein [Rosellinia necatrix]